MTRKLIHRRQVKNRSKHSRKYKKTRRGKYIKKRRGVTRRRVLRGGVDDYDDKFNKLANYTFDAKDKDFKPTEESEKMLRYYIDMLPEKKEDLIMLSKIDTSLLNQSKRKSLASRFKVPKFDGQSNKLSFTGVK